MFQFFKRQQELGEWLRLTRIKQSSMAGCMAAQHAMIIALLRSIPEDKREAIVDECKGTVGAGFANFKISQGVTEDEQKAFLNHASAELQSYIEDLKSPGLSVADEP